MRYSLLSLFVLLFICACQPVADENSVKNPENNTRIKADIVEANGELASSKTAVISPPNVKNQWQYKITYLPPEGSEAIKDQPIIRFDTSQLTQKLMVKNGELKTKQKTLENTRLTNDAELERLKLELAQANMEKDKAYRKWNKSNGLESNLETNQLALEHEIAKNEARRLDRSLDKTIESNRINIAIEENNVSRLQTEVNQIQNGIQRMTILAPKSGIVIYKTDHQGNKVSVGDSVWMGRQLLGLPSLDSMIVKAEILEADAGKVSIGQNVKIVLDAAPERIFKGYVSVLGQIFRRKSLDQPNIIFDAEITITEPDSELMRPGMAARLKISLTKPSVEKVIAEAVPISTILASTATTSKKDIQK